MTQSRSFLLPPLPPESQRPDSAGWRLRLASRTACFGAGGLLAVGLAAQIINEDQNAPYWPLVAVHVGQAAGVFGSWAREGWRFVREGRRGLGAGLILLGPVVAAVVGGATWIVTIWALFAMS